MKKTRRDFIKNALGASAAISIGGVLPGFSAKSYGSILGSNERIKVGVMGVNARGLALAKNFSAQENCEIISISDVDKNAMNKCVDEVGKIQDSKPKAFGDFRKALESNELDAMVIATPDHWHAPATILACQAGKHVYVEKPCSHNPHEGELLIKAARKYDRKVQMGSQRRSWPNTREAIQNIHDGIIGNVYFAKGWYAANRDSIGKGKKVETPDWLDFDLWQGPAPREEYRDNILHYDWHWYWNWGTGEAGNNATHFVDLMRWGFKADYPISAGSAGGRYRYDDDWETPDTQIMTWEFPNNKLMEFESRSCNAREIEGSTVGVAFYGEKGTLVLNGWNAYKVYDLENKLIRDVKNNASSMAAGSKISPTQALDALHIQNFFDGIRKDESLNINIEDGHKSTVLIQLANIAQRAGSSLKIDSENGHILDNEDAKKYWKRAYEKGWEPKV